MQAGCRLDILAWEPHWGLEAQCAGFPLSRHPSVTATHLKHPKGERSDTGSGW